MNSSEFKSTAKDDSSSSLKIFLKILAVSSFNLNNSVSLITLSLAKRPQCAGLHVADFSESLKVKLSGGQSTLCSRRLKTSLIPASVVVFSFADVKYTIMKTADDRTTRANTFWFLNEGGRDVNFLEFIKFLKTQ